MITFPGLGLQFNINPIAFSAFGKEVYWYGIIIATALLVNILLALRDAPKFGIKQDDIIDLLIFAVPAAIIGARIYFVVFKWEYYALYPEDIVAIWKGGMAIYGAVLAAIAAAYIFAKHKKIGVLKLFDFCAPYLPLGQAIGRWGNFVNQEAYGSQTTLPWRMEITAPDNITRIAVHPTFLYESLWNLLLFAFLIWYRKKNKPQGEVFFLYLIIYGLGRFWIEGLRTDSLMLGSFRVSQLLAGILVIVFSAVLVIRRRHSPHREKASNKGNSTSIASKR